MPPSPSAKVVSDIGHNDRHFGALDADAADHEVHSILLISGHMLGSCPLFRFLGIRPSVALWHRLIFRLLSVDSAGLASTGQERFIGLRSISRVRPNRWGRVGPIDQPLAQPSAVLGSGIRHDLTTGEAMSGIDTDMGFVTKRGDRDVRLRTPLSVDLALRDLHRPTSIGILLGGLRRLIRPDLISRFAGFDRIFLIPGVSLPGGSNQACINNLS